MLSRVWEDEMERGVGDAEAGSGLVSHGKPLFSVHHRAMERHQVFIFCFCLNMSVMIRFVCVCVFSDLCLKKTILTEVRIWEWRVGDEAILEKRAAIRTT